MKLQVVLFLLTALALRVEICVLPMRKSICNIPSAFGPSFVFFLVYKMETEVQLITRILLMYVLIYRTYGGRGGGS